MPQVQILSPRLIAKPVTDWVSRRLPKAVFLCQLQELRNALFKQRNRSDFAQNNLVTEIRLRLVQT